MLDPAGIPLVDEGPIVTIFDPVGIPLGDEGPIVAMVDPVGEEGPMTVIVGPVKIPLGEDSIAPLGGLGELDGKISIPFGGGVTKGPVGGGKP